MGLFFVFEVKYASRLPGHLSLLAPMGSKAGRGPLGILFCLKREMPQAKPPFRNRPSLQGAMGQGASAGASAPQMKDFAGQRGGPALWKGESKLAPRMGPGFRRRTKQIQGLAARRKRHNEREYRSHRSHVPEG